VRREGHISGRRTVGLLQRRHIYIDSIRYIGKDSNSLEEVDAGLANSEQSVYTEYGPTSGWMAGEDFASAEEGAACGSAGGNRYVQAGAVGFEGGKEQAEGAEQPSALGWMAAPVTLMLSHGRSNKTAGPVRGV
jgi:hypothetical protein